MLPSLFHLVTGAAWAYHIFHWAFPGEPHVTEMMNVKKHAFHPAVLAPPAITFQNIFPLFVPPGILQEFGISF
jgi:hypothetical protein